MIRNVCFKWNKINGHFLPQKIIVWFEGYYTIDTNDGHNEWFLYSIESFGIEQKYKWQSSWLFNELK